MKKRMMLIINPMAGRSGYKTGFGEVMNILDSGGYLTTVYFTQGRGDATVFAAQHAAEYDTVACIGGDGTLSEVVSGLMQVPNPPPLGYLPERKAGARPPGLRARGDGPAQQHRPLLRARGV